MDTLLTNNWTQGNTDDRIPTITDNLVKPWEDLDFGQEDIIYIQYDDEDIKTGFYGLEFYHRIPLSIEIVSPSLAGDADGRSHFNKVLKEVARIIKANPRQSGYQDCRIRSTRARYNKSQNQYVATVMLEYRKVTTS